MTAALVLIPETQAAGQKWRPECVECRWRGRAQIHYRTVHRLMDEHNRDEHPDEYIPHRMELLAGEAALDGRPIFRCVSCRFTEAVDDPASAPACVLALPTD